VVAGVRGDGTASWLGAAGGVLTVFTVLIKVSIFGLRPAEGLGAVIKDLFTVFTSGLRPAGGM